MVWVVLAFGSVVQEYSSVKNIDSIHLELCFPKENLLENILNNDLFFYSLEVFHQNFLFN